MTTYACKPVVKYLRHDEAFTYHGDWELPVRALRLIMPAGDEAGELMKRLRQAVVAFSECQPCLYVPVVFNGNVEYTDSEGDNIVLPSVVRVYGPNHAMLEISLSDELRSQSIFHELVGSSDHALAPDIDALDKMLQSRKDDTPWMQRDIVCLMHKPSREPFRGGGEGLVVPFHAYVVVSRWHGDDRYLDTPVPATLVTEGKMFIPDSGTISINCEQEKNRDILHGTIVVLSYSECKAAKRTIYNVLRENLLNEHMNGLSEYGLELVDKLTGKRKEDSCSVTTVLIESKKIKEFTLLTL